MTRPAHDYVTPFRSQDFSLRSDVSEIEGLRRLLREKDAEIFRLRSQLAALAEQNERLVSKHDAHLGVTCE